MVSVTASQCTKLTEHQLHRRVRQLRQHWDLTTRDTIRHSGHLGGRIQGGNVSLAARTDVNNVGGQIIDTDNLVVGTGRTGGNSGSSTTLVGTQVTSLHGNVSLEARETFTQTASQIATPEGNVDIAAKQVSILQGEETGESQSSVRYGKTAFGGSISIPLVSALQSIKGMADATKDTGDARMKGLAAVNTALAAKQVYDAAGSLKGSVSGIKVSVNLSHDESRSADQQSGRNAVGSLIAAGGDVSVHALGAGQDSTLSVVGSQIDAGRDVHLKSDGAVVLKAAENTAHQQGTNSSSGVSIGVGFTFGGSQNGFTIDLAASMSRGKADGDDSLWTHTHVNAGKTFTLESGGDTTLQGAVVQADRITGKVGGNLSIASLQDSSTFNSQQMSAGFAISLCIPPICEGMSSVSADASQSEIDSRAIRVAEQSGFKAGDGGYQFTVKGNTDLTGGVIASSDKAIAEGKNQFDHGGAITQRDIENRLEFKGSSWAVSAGVGGKPAEGSTGALGKASTTSTSPTHQDNQPSASFGLGFDEGLQTSVTRSGIGVSTSEDTAGILKPIFDAGKVQRELNAQTRITKTFSQAAPRAIAEFANTQTRPVEEAQEYERLQGKEKSGEKLTADESRKMADLEERGMTAERARANLSDSKALENYENWKEGGLYRVAAHTVAGALSGGVNGALGGGVVAGAAPVLSDLQNDVVQSLTTNGMSQPVALLVSQALAEATSASLGGAVGGTVGAGFGMAVDTNNRQLHLTEADLIRRNAARYATERNISVAQAETELTQQALRQVDSAWAQRFGDNPEAAKFLSTLARASSGTDVGGGTLFDARGTAAFGDHSINAAFLPRTADLYNHFNSRNTRGLAPNVSGAYLAYNDAAHDPKLLEKAQPQILQLLKVGALLKERATTAQEGMAVLSGNLGISQGAFGAGKVKPGDGTQLTDVLIGSMGEAIMTGLPSEGGFALPSAAGKTGSIGTAGPVLPTTTSNRVDGLLRVPSEAEGTGLLGPVGGKINQAVINTTGDAVSPGFDTSNLQNKLQGYLLDPAHPQNQTKAVWFDQALGFNKENWQNLASQLKFDQTKAVQTKTGQYGTTYEQIIPVAGANGNTVNTTFVFMKDNNGVVRLVTGIPSKR